MQFSHCRKQLWFSTWAIVAAALSPSACKTASIPNPTGDQAASQDLPLSPIEQLGQALFLDDGLSSPKGQSCASCHLAEAGWTGGEHALNQKGSVYPGAVPSRFGNRKPPSVAYASHSPPLHLENGEFVGGMFWDGRATGLQLGAPLTEQAMGPFLNPLEQNLPSQQTLCERVAASSYVKLYAEVWGAAPDCSTPADINNTYESVAQSISAFEASSAVNPYSSKYDHFLHDEASLSPSEWTGLVLFNGKAKCANCHSGPDFTDYTYDNLGIPRNRDNPFYQMDREFIDGQPINPDGPTWADPGLGGFLATEAKWKALAAENTAKHKVPTLRNVAASPKPPFVKAYTHNGVFKSLQEVVHFYNTRDLPNQAWDPPEYPNNINGRELGDLGLTTSEEQDLVAFLLTLTDGWKP
jgi:cytochrome c peroxidase